eukprot:365535-Chlamydomonas_euryale.AAC.5
MWRFCTSLVRVLRSPEWCRCILAASSVSALSRSWFSVMACCCAAARAKRSRNPTACTGHRPSGLDGPPAAASTCRHLISSTLGGLTRELGSRTTLRKRC